MNPPCGVGLLITKNCWLSILFSSTNCSPPLELECMFRRLIHTRVLLLNILTK
ncbi:hypothetical protein GLYMA_19G111850v4 [Glycine max]|nr:hypothetical protein GLYMA_19G111850v4 [Glycine max]KAH1077309.1 hypothetical protein GYH30_052714 [Glycine max]